MTLYCSAACVAEAAGAAAGLPGGSGAPAQIQPGFQGHLVGQPSPAHAALSDSQDLPRIQHALLWSVLRGACGQGAPGVMFCASRRSSSTARVGLKVTWRVSAVLPSNRAVWVSALAGAHEAQSLYARRMITMRQLAGNVTAAFLSAVCGRGEARHVFTSCSAPFASCSAPFGEDLGSRAGELVALSEVFGN